MKSILIIAAVGLFATVSSAQPAKTFQRDSAQIHQTITTFYNWYNKNYRKFMVYDLYDGTTTTDKPPYRIQWKEVERYFGFIRSSVPQLGEAFIKNMRMFFQQCDSAFKVDVEDEIPYGFDYDWYTNSQEEPQYLIDELKKAKQWVTTINGNDAKLEVKGTESTVMCFEMKKEKGKWTIAQIGCSY